MKAETFYTIYTTILFHFQHFGFCVSWTIKENENFLPKLDYKNCTYKISRWPVNSLSFKVVFWLVCLWTCVVAAVTLWEFSLKIQKFASGCLWSPKLQIYRLWSCLTVWSRSTDLDWWPKISARFLSWLSSFVSDRPKSHSLKSCQAFMVTSFK